ncbi:ParA family protein [Acidianus sp. HS-5]|uniref:ParA family protein n=1 Tax=Acidianus sp. HS-5 TaxID=2886040 RepID=UPI001F3D092B|nr:ParA family protein [Acidianus sp. HS-5]BDC18466.1 hypothetical protein HS5_13560 [Acidianus sp. HS-5]
MRLSVLSTKGGVGKSTIALLLSKYLSQNGVKTLLIDRDPVGWTSNLAKIKGKGLLASVVDKEDKEDYFKEVKTKDGGDFYILKLYGDGVRFYVDLGIIRKNENLYKKIREKYQGIVKNGFQAFIVDNPSMIQWNDDEVQCELSLFKETFPEEKIYRLYISDSSEISVESTLRYIREIERSSQRIGQYIGIVINLVPPFPEDLERAMRVANRFEGIKVVIPFIESLFMLNDINVELPEQVKYLGKEILKLNSKV